MKVITHLTPNLLEHLSTNHIQIAPSPGAKKIIVPKSIEYLYKKGTVDYALNRNIRDRFFFGTTVAEFSGTGYNLSEIFGKQADAFQSQQLTTNGPIATADAVGQPLLFGVTGGDFAGGDGTVTIILEYEIEQL